MADERADLVVIGAGPGGYAAAFLAADLGLEVVLVDPEENPGGVCSYRGCIPSKALLHAAKLIDDAREAEAIGLRFGRPEIDVTRLRAWKDEIVAQLTGGLAGLAKRRGVRRLRGRARLEGPHATRVEAEDGSLARVGFEHAILATGSEPASVPGIDLAHPKVWDSTAALDLERVPERLLVVGGGYIGLELGSVYASLGSRVTLVELTDALLPGVDPDLVKPVAKRVGRAFESVQLETRVVGVREDGERLQVRTEGASGGEASFDRVLVAVGRRPVADDLGLETTKLTADERGFIRVDAERRTAEPSIFAIGDVTGEPMLAHKATHEGRVAAHVVAGRPDAFEPRAIPAVVFTDPEIAWCGLTEGEARAAGREVAVGRFPWGASGRAATLGRGDGLTKWIADPETGRLLGLGLSGPGAGELIAEGVLALEMGANAEDLARSIHPHPTLSETLMEAAEVVLGTATHVYRPR